jgi:hypothetical protein
MDLTMLESPRMHAAFRIRVPCPRCPAEITATFPSPGPAHRFMVTLLLCAALVLQGCASNFGPSSVRKERPNYNREIVQSHDEQMLLNLVRLRYRDTPLFVELTSVVTSYAFDQNLSLGAKLFDGKVGDEYSAGAGLLIGNRPTVTYLPLQGEEFAIRMLSPLPLDSIMLFSQTGWSVERLMLLCVQRINDLENAPSATGPTPVNKPEYEAFRDLAARLRRLAVAGRFGMNWDFGEDAADQSAYHMKFWLTSPADPKDPLAKDAAAVRKALQIDPSLEEYNMTPFPYKRRPDEVGVRGRSLLGVLYFLSQSVEPPREHAESGLVTVTLDAQGQAFDWGMLLKDTMRIRSSKERPAKAFVAVSHRGWWFYIADDDLTSKSSLSLLNFLFSLQSASGKGKSPVLTLPVGR